MGLSDEMWDDLEPDDLPGDLREIAKDRGMEEARYLAERWGGILLYIPARSTIEKQWRDERIPQEFDGSNAGDLAEKYGVSRRYIYAVIRDVSDD